MLDPLYNETKVVLFSFFLSFFFFGGGGGRDTHTKKNIVMIVLSINFLLALSISDSFSVSISVSLSFDLSTYLSVKLYLSVSPCFCVVVSPSQSDSLPMRLIINLPLLFYLSACLSPPLCFQHHYVTFVWLSFNSLILNILTTAPLLRSRPFLPHNTSSSEMATAMRTKERKKERAKEFMKKLKSMLPNKKNVGKMDTLSTLEQLVDSMRQLNGQLPTDGSSLINFHNNWHFERYKNSIVKKKNNQKKKKTTPRNRRR